MDRTSLNLRIIGAILVGATLGIALVMLSLNYRPFLGPSDPPEDYPTLLIGVTGFVTAAVAYVIAKLHYRKQSWT